MKAKATPPFLPLIALPATRTKVTLPPTGDGDGLVRPRPFLVQALLLHSRQPGAHRSGRRPRAGAQD